MSELATYFDFVKSHGKSLSTRYPGSKEFAFSQDDAFQAIELLKKTKTPILGGDVLTLDEDGLIYAYQSWGQGYHYLSWNCENNNTEILEEYTFRSYDKAIDAINHATVVAEKLEKKCFFVLVV